MRLQDRLNEMRQQFETGAPAEALAVMHRATADLRRSGIMDRVLKVGDPVPGFTLPGIDGALFDSAAMLAKGPLVLGFYRGVW